MSTKPVLRSTKDYSKFELCRFNRSVSKTGALRESMKKHGFIPAYPIHCVAGEGRRLEVKAGHHRLEVAQELGIEVYYVVSDDSISIHEAETSTNPWRLADYMESFAKCGLEAYQEVREYHERTGIPLSLCMSMFSGEIAGSGNKVKQFKSGGLVIKGREHAAIVADIVSACEEAGIDARRSIFVQAVSKCLCVPQFSAETFKQRAAVNASMFKNMRIVDEQIELFEQVYNHKTFAKNKLPLAFLVRSAMAARVVCPRNQAKEDSQC